MKLLNVIITSFFFFISVSLNAQNNFSCTETLPWSSNVILKIFDRVEDHSIRGATQPDASWNSVICLENQVEEASVFISMNGNDGVKFVFLKDGEKEKAAQLYGQLKGKLQTFKPTGWEESEKAPYTNQYFYLKNGDENPSREIKLKLERLYDKYSVHMTFSSFGARQTAAIPDGFVSSVNKVIADYPNRFENITGKVIPELVNYVYEAKVNIPGSSYCRIVNTPASGLYFSADYIATYSVSEEAYQQAVKKINELVSIFENTSFSIPLVKSKNKHTGNKQDMGDQEEQEFISSSGDARFNSMAIRIVLSKNYEVKDQMNPKSWQQYYNVSIRIKQ